MNKILPNLSEQTIRRFEQFQEDVFGTDNKVATSPVENQVFIRNLHSIRYAAVIFIVTNIFWLIMDISRKGAMHLTSGPALFAIILQIAFSLYMLFLPLFLKENSDRLVRCSFLLYYICIIFNVTVLITVKNIQMFNAGTNYSLAGLSLSTCLLFIFILAPLPSLRDSLILGVIFLVSLFVPMFLPGHELYSISQQCIVRACIIAAYIYTRKVNLDLADSIQRLSVLSFIDALTDTFNRRALDIYWEHLCSSEDVKSISVLIFDIDDFKKYNDCYTHAKGNDVLKAVCLAVSNALTDDTSFLFRYGGEEFVVLLPNYSAQEAVLCSQRVKEAVFNAFILRNDGSRFDRITITVGCALEIPEPGCSDYIIHADEQLYIGKSSGKNCVVFDGKVCQFS